MLCFGDGGGDVSGLGEAVDGGSPFFSVGEGAGCIEGPAAVGFPEGGAPEGGLGGAPAPDGLEYIPLGREGSFFWGIEGFSAEVGFAGADGFGEGAEGCSLAPGFGGAGDSGGFAVAPLGGLGGVFPSGGFGGAAAAPLGFE